MSKISQREARRLQKRVAELEAELDKQRHASDLVLKHVKGLAGLRVCADEKIRFAKGSGGKISLGNRRHLEFREWP